MSKTAILKNMAARKRAREGPPSGSSENEDTSSQNDSDEVRQSSGPSPGSRKERRAKRKELYLRGEARKSYHF